MFAFLFFNVWDYFLWMGISFESLNFLHFKYCYVKLISYLESWAAAKISNHLQFRENEKSDSTN